MTSNSPAVLEGPTLSPDLADLLAKSFRTKSASYSQLFSMDSKYDYIVIGGGTSGLVVASRLTEDSNTNVLVLEAGGDHSAHPQVQTPGFWPANIGSPDRDWSYTTVPQKGLEGKVVPLVQGKLLGGSSSINSMAFVSNSKTAIDAWGKFGNHDWSWEALAPYYKKFHTLSRPSDATVEHLRLNIDDALHSDGPVHVSFPEDTENPLTSAWVNAFATLGLPSNSDPFTGTMTGGYINSATIDAKTRTRSSAAISYLEPAKSRPNLHVETSVLVHKIIFDTTGEKPKAIGVELLKEGRTTIFNASKEIILAAGTVGSPKLLELSGVGDRDRLENLGIKVIVDNPNVGENFQDHASVGLSFEVMDGIKTLDSLNRQEPEAIQEAMMQYMQDKTGPFSSNSNIAAAMLPLPELLNGSDAALELDEVIEGLWNDKIIDDDFTPEHSAFVRSVLGKPTEPTANVFAFEAGANFLPEAGGDIMSSKQIQGNFLSICAYLYYPLSRGSIHITSSDPAQKPAINPRYLEHPLDLELMARHLSFIETLIRTEPLSKCLKPNGRRSHGAPTDLRDLNTTKAYIKKAALSAWHLTSSCAMLPRNKGGVVDSELCVHGVQGLRIVDASIMPIATRGNSQSTVYAVAERAASLIKLGNA